MVSNKYPIIAREGWPMLMVLAALFLLGAYFIHPLVILPGSLLAIVAAFVFRDPVRRVPSAPLGVVCPVDGVVLAIEKRTDPYLQRESLCIELRMNAGGVYSIRSPIEGKITQQWQQGGVNASFANCVQTDEGDQILWSMRRNTLTSPRCYVHAGERVGQGQRCGFWLFGGKLRVYLPINARMDVAVGNKLTGGEDILATLVHQQAVSSITE